MAQFNYSQSWKQVEAHLEKGLPKSANQVLNDIYNHAVKDKNHPEQLKVLITRLNTNTSVSDSSEIENFNKIEKEIAAATGAPKAILQSIKAQFLYGYYQDNRYRFRNRTALQDDNSTDITAWTSDKLLKETALAYQASLSNEAVLKQIKISDYDTILIKGNTRKLRPTLYDFLAHRALDFFKSDAIGIARPANQFQVKDPEAFAPATVFAAHTFTTTDTASLQYHAVLLLQDLIRFHANDKAALLDVDIERISYMNQVAVLSGKDKLYLKALEDLATATKGQSGYAEVIVLRAQYFLNKGYAGKQDSVSFKKAYQLCMEVIGLKTNTAANHRCQEIIRALQQKDLNLTTELVNLPGLPFRSLVSYKNINKVFLRLVKVDESFAKNLQVEAKNYKDRDAYFKALLNSRDLRSWSQELPDPKDFRSHSAEIKVDALPLGQYALISSSGSGFNLKTDFLTAQLIWVSNLSYIESGEQFYVLNRSSGKPIANVQIEVYRDLGEQLRKDTVLTSANDGSFKILRPTTATRRLLLKSGDDRLWVNDLFYYYNQSKPEKEEYNTLIFTDRKIYRPGQILYFKGIVTSKDKKGRNAVAANYRTTITLFDANGGKVDSLPVTSNDYGSYSGKFILPTGLLNGQFSLKDARNTFAQHFSVEEYKRPKFHVDFDTLKQQVKLGETVTLKGKALAYAGNNIDGATVRYTVTRQVRFPYPWLFWKIIAPPGNVQEIANGETTTDATGQFSVTFPAIPDETVDVTTKPVFTYSINADVTDLNGETRSASQNLSLGYQAMELVITTPSTVQQQELDEIKVTSHTLNGNFIPANITVSFKRLQPASRLLRPRYWEAPDQFVMSEADYIKAFPVDIYNKEDDPALWERKAVAYQQNIATNAEGAIDLSKAKLTPGYYEIEAKATDKNGEELIQKETFELVDPGAKELTVPSYFRMYANDKAVQPGTTAEVALGTSVKDLHIIELKSQWEQGLKTRAFSLTGVKQLRYPVTETDRGNIMLVYGTVKDNRLFTVQQSIRVPWDNKELDLKIGTHRDKLLPGEKEKWTISIAGAKGSKATAEMIASMYDASLDALTNNYWLMPDWNPVTPWLAGFAGNTNFINISSRQHIIQEEGTPVTYDKQYDALIPIPVSRYRVMMKSALYGSRALPAAPEMAESSVAYGIVEDKMKEVNVPSAAATEQAEEQPVPPRRNFEETAFFYPDLKTDENGNIIFEFTMPESLTKWNFTAAAHTKDLAFGMVRTSIVTQKTLMVVPNAPRFVREGDKMNFTAKVSNLADSMLIGQARLELLDAATMQPVDGWFQNIFPVQHFTAQANQSTVVSFQVQVPHGFKSTLLYRVVAQAGKFSDGEENVIPVLSNSMLVTESLPIQMKGDGKQSFKFEKLLHSDSSTTLQQQGITVEYTSNPAWYAVQSLPYLMEYPYQCSEQVFNRYYANYLAGYIVNHAPGIKQVFEKWKTTDTTALLSNLQKNEELKTLLLEQTPWVLEAKTEAEQKRNIALLFDLQKMKSELQKAMGQLAEKQLPDGSFPWFAGMVSDRFITQYIVAGIGHLQKISGTEDQNSLQILTNAIGYLDKALDKDYHQLLNAKSKLDQQQIGYTQIYYLYARSFFNIPVDPAMKQAFDYYNAQAKKYWTRQSIYAQGMLALLLSRSGDKKTAAEIIRSLKERAIDHAEKGMYWKEVEAGYSWHEAPIETQALMIEAFSEIGNNANEVINLKTWLLKNKQTNNWSTTKATADAVYAVLLKGGNWLSAAPAVTIQLGNTAIQPAKEEAGTGYIKEKIAAKAVKPEMGNIELTVANSNAQPSWGAVYWQYFEELDKITFAKTPLSIEKQLYKEVNGNSGPVLTKIDENNELKVGDRVKVRIIVRADRPMEYVHLRDMRAACFEPKDVISTAKWQDGLSFYQSTKDASMDFFFNYLTKGTHVFEYTMFVTHTGKYSNGISTAECMYAPEFSSHSEGINVKVAE